ncbi:MAG: hypothetical protein PHD76_06965 [Methylacidiphilales bacterium]|nr:hypothetical protein [Candidatus Methylacidiphilales bacterium]
MSLQILPKNNSRAGTRKSAAKLIRSASHTPLGEVRYHVESGICRGVWIDGVYVRVHRDGRMTLES